MAKPCGRHRRARTFGLVLSAPLALVGRKAPVVAAVGIVAVGAGSALHSGGALAGGLSPAAETVSLQLLSVDSIGTQAEATAARVRDRKAELAEAARAAAAAKAAADAAAAAKAQAIVDAAVADPRGAARSLLPTFGWDAAQFQCLDQLWQHESGWKHTATNPTSGAYGIAQSLPADKMSSVAGDWATNPITQVTWGMGYIKASYGTPCGAWSFWQARRWY